jgi:hypothetical protein
MVVIRFGLELDPPRPFLFFEKPRIRSLEIEM